MLVLSADTYVRWIPALPAKKLADSKNGCSFSQFSCKSCRAQRRLFRPVKALPAAAIVGAAILTYQPFALQLLTGFGRLTAALAPAVP